MFFLSVLFARLCFDFAIAFLHKLDTCSPDFGFELVSGNSRLMKAKKQNRLCYRFALSCRLRFSPRGQWAGTRATYIMQEEIAKGRRLFCCNLFFFSFRMVSLCSRQCVSGHLLYGDCFKTVCSAFIFFQDRMEHHGYACIDITLVNSTSLFPGGARREEIELT